MDRCLVIANKTLLSDELLAAMQKRCAEREYEFVLLVPASHPWGSWSEGSIKAAATERLAEGIAHFEEHGIDCTGEVGVANVVHAATDVLLRERFDEIIVSTLPAGPSKWIHEDVPTRIARIASVPVSHVVSERAHAPSM